MWENDIPVIPKAKCRQCHPAPGQ